MKKLNNLKPLMVAVVLIGIGLISPSNGVDAALDKSPKELLITVLVVLLLSPALLMIVSLLRKTNEHQQ